VVVSVASAKSALETVFLRRAYLDVKERRRLRIWLLMLYSR
jgi:hypothetical protein